MTTVLAVGLAVPFVSFAVFVICVPDLGRVVFGEPVAVVILPPTEVAVFFAAAVVVPVLDFTGFLALAGEREAAVVEEVDRLETVDFVGTGFGLAVVVFTVDFVFAGEAPVDALVALDVLDLEPTVAVVVVLAEPVGRVVPGADFPDDGRAGDALAVVLVVAVDLVVAEVVLVEVAGDLGVDVFTVLTGEPFVAGFVAPGRWVLEASDDVDFF